MQPGEADSIKSITTVAGFKTRGYTRSTVLTCKTFLSVKNKLGTGNFDIIFPPTITF